MLGNVVRVVVGLGSIDVATGPRRVREQVVVPIRVVPSNRKPNVPELSRPGGFLRCAERSNATAARAIDRFCRFGPRLDPRAIPKARARAPDPGLAGGVVRVPSARCGTASHRDVPGRWWDLRARGVAPTNDRCRNVAVQLAVLDRDAGIWQHSFRAPRGLPA